jgi:hypothetical protein
MWGAPLLNRWLGGSRPVPTRQARREPPPEGRPTPAPAKARGADAAPDPRRPRRAPDLQPARPNTDPAITRPGSFPAASAKWRTRHPAPNRLPQRRSEARAAALSGHTRPPRTSGAQPAAPPRSADLPRPKAGPAAPPRTAQPPGTPAYKPELRPPGSVARPKPKASPSHATTNRRATGDPAVQDRAQRAHGPPRAPSGRRRPPGDGRSLFGHSVIGSGLVRRPRPGRRCRCGGGCRPG